MMAIYLRIPIEQTDHGSPQLLKFSADLRSASPFDAGASTRSGIAGHQ
jgi:hypothetical protein